jgi:iron complex transport system permease protein
MSLGRTLLLLFLALVGAVGLSLLAGPVWLPPSAWFSDARAGVILFELRLPRTLLAALIGAALGLGGAVMQGFLRNPLADPGLFGVSASAALGAVLAIWMGAAALQPLMLPAFALMGAALGMAALALLVGQAQSIVLFTLAGLILSSLAGSLTAFLISIAPSPFVTAQIVTWLMGAVTDRSWQDVWLAAPLIAAGATILWPVARGLDALTLGELSARSMGVNLERLQWQIVIGVGLLVGASVAVAGVIGFVGLMVPHLVRPLVGHRPSAVLPAAAIAGALLLVLADSVVRILPTASELRLGIAMSLVGAPFFLALLLNMRRQLA